MFACIAAGVVVWAWTRAGDLRLKGAVLVTTSLMVTPYALDYDLMLVALPLAWLVAVGLETGFRPYEKTVLIATFLLPLFSRLLGMMLFLPITPVMLLLLWALVRRMAASPHAAE